MDINVFQADYSNPRQAKEIVDLLNIYVLDPMGGGEALRDNVKTSLVSALAKIPQAFSILCYVDDEAAGLVNCFQAFSTFACKPVINIHDVMVCDEYRGLGLCRRMLDKVEAIARERGCCKVTLEVLEGNQTAQAAYKKLGYAGYEIDPRLGKALFWQKQLPSISAQT